MNAQRPAWEKEVLVSIPVCRPASRSNVVALAAVVFLLSDTAAQAYIGPGAGFAAASSMFGIALAMLAGILALITAPVRAIFRWFRRRRAHARARVNRVVVLGLDGMEPKLTEKFLGEGKLPNLKKLMEQGSYQRLGTTAPPLSPVAWSTFLTGSNPGKHNVFDFLTRNKQNYLPELSSVHVSSHRRTFRLLGKDVPYGAPEIRGLRRGKPFWNTLGEYGIFSDIIRVPISFPPERFRGLVLSAMCVPDLRGSQGTFSFYTTRKAGEGEHTGGEQIRVERKGNAVESYLVGPPGQDGKPIHTPFRATIDDVAGTVSLKVCGETLNLVKDEYTPWVTVDFKLGFMKKVTGICQFLLLQTSPELELYVTPIQIDPAAPAMPISFPNVYATYLAKKQGPYATLGLAEDTWAMNEKILTDDGFLHQAVEADQEREIMFMDALDKVKEGLCVCVFDGTDRIQHMFWRYIDPKHPARKGQTEQSLQRRKAIEDLYLRNDELVGRTMKKCNDENTLLLVISDHGFNSFRRGLDLNRWLIENGYMALKADAKPGAKYLKNVDWSKTRAYCLGLAGLWLNVEGREAQGIVKPGAEEEALREELCEKLTGLVDEETGDVAVRRAMNSRRIYRGPYTSEAPDIIMGWMEGYRVSWESAIGDITDKTFHDNMKAWSGDHSIDPTLVPGVMFSNRWIEADKPRLMDIGPTALDMFGVKVPGYMDGKPLEVLDWNHRPAAGANGRPPATTVEAAATEAS